MKFIVKIPILEPKSAGVRCLIHLAAMLNQAGYHAEINGIPGPDDIAVYPDIVLGNPDQAKKVLRYMLYYPTSYFGGDRIPAEQCVIVYNQQYFSSTAEHYDGKLTSANVLAMPVIEAGLCSPGEKTIEKVLYLGKHNAGKRPDEEMPLITREAMSREGCINLLRSARNLYSCDNRSAILVEAVLCGCQPWIMGPDDKFEKILIPDAESYVQDTARDRITARRFAEIALDFFRV